MPGVIGNNTIGGSAANLPTTPLATVAVALTYLAVAGDVIDQFWFYGHNGFVAGGNVDIAVYDVSAGLPNNRTHAAVNIPLLNQTAQWWSTATGLALALVPGVTYCISVIRFLGARGYHNTSVNGRSNDLTAGSLPATWFHSSYSTSEFSLYANVIAGGGPVGVPSGISDDFDLLNY